MRRINANIPALVIPIFLLILSASAFANDRFRKDILSFQEGDGRIEIPPPDSTDLQYPFSQKDNYPFSNSGNNSPLYLKDPPNIKRVVEYDPVTGTYSFTEKVGEFNYNTPAVMRPGAWSPCHV